MANAKKLPSGNWRTQILDYTDPQGKKHMKSFTAPTKKESEYLAIQYCLSDRKDEKDMNVKDLIDRYIESKSSVLSPATIKGYKSYSKAFEPIESLKISKLNSYTIQTWISGLSSYRSPKYVCNVFGLLNASLKFFDYNINLKKIKLPQKEIKDIYVPTNDEVKQLIDYFKENDKDMLNAVYLSAYGTLRRSEIAAATANDINGNVLTVDKALVWDGSRWITKKTKNTSSTRKIELPDFVIDSLPKKGNLVNLNPNQLSDRIKRTVKRLGMNHFSIHALRHYAASVMHSIGIPDVYIMEKGGWSSDHTLKKIYRNSLSDFSKEFNDKANNYFKSLNS